MNSHEPEKLPPNARAYIEKVAAKASPLARTRLEVTRELSAHFTDAIGASNGSAEEAADRLIREFGEPRLLARLIRRGKARCRPVWQRALLWAFSLGLLTGGPILAYGLYLNFVGAPVLETDYLAVLNERAQPKGADPDQNAWPHYLLAMTTLDHPDEIKELLNTWQPGCGCNGNPQQAPPLLDVNQLPVVKAWLDRNSAVWQECVVGAGKPWCWRTYEARDGDRRLWAVGPTYEIPRNWLTITHIPLRFACHRETGQIDAAVEDALVLAKMGAHFSRFGAWTSGEQEYGFNNFAYACTMLTSLIRQLARDRVTSIQAQLEAMMPDGFPETDSATFRLAALDLVQHTYSSGGVFGGHFMPRYFRTVEGYYPGVNAYAEHGPFSKLALPVLYTIGGMLVPGRNSAESRIEQTYAQYAPLLQMPPHELHEAGYAAAWPAPQPHKPNLLIRAIQYPARAIAWSAQTVLQRAGVEHRWMILYAEDRYASKAAYEATLALIALQLYRLDNRQYPDSLDALLPDYLRELPIDPWSGDPLRYDKQLNGIRLYAVGRDFTDNGGQHPGTDGQAGQADVVYADWQEG